MAQTVIGMFDNAAEAQQAVQKLTSRGISRDNIDVKNNAVSDSSASNTDTEESGIGHFFRSLFSDNDDERDKYSNVAKRSQSIVTVHAQSADEAEDAADILDECGAVNVDERAASFGSSNRDSGTASFGNTGSNDDTTRIRNTTSGVGDTGTTGGTTGILGSPSATGSYRDTATTDETAGVSGATLGTGRYGAGTTDQTTGILGSTSGSSSYDTSRATDETTRLQDSGRDSYTNTGSTDDTTRTQGTGSFDRTGSTDETTRIPIIEENLQVGKREVVRGGTRVRSRIIERPVEETLRLREESVRVERNPVDRAATSSDLENFQERQIEMTETAEVPVVSKEARVVEEVSLGKEVNGRTETVSDTVRKTEVDVENLDTRQDGDDTNRTGYNNSGNRTDNF